MCVCALHPLDLSTTEKGRRGVLEVVEPDVWDNRSAHYVERPVPAPRPRDTPTPPGRTANKVGICIVAWVALQCSFRCTTREHGRHVSHLHTVSGARIVTFILSLYH